MLFMSTEHGDVFCLQMFCPFFICPWLPLNSLKRQKKQTKKVFFFFFSPGEYYLTQKKEDFSTKQNPLFLWLCFASFMKTIIYSYGLTQKEAEHHVNALLLPLRGMGERTGKKVKLIG